MDSKKTGDLHENECENVGSMWGQSTCFTIYGRLDSSHTTTTRSEPAATREGEDYVGFGPIFTTDTKLNPDPVVGIQGLRHIRLLTPLPVFAIGGIRAESVAELCAAGANGVAVVSGILDAVDRQQAFTQYLASFQ